MSNEFNNLIFSLIKSILFAYKFKAVKQKGVVRKWRHGLMMRGSMILWRQYKGLSEKCVTIKNYPKLCEIIYGRTLLRNNYQFLFIRFFNVEDFVLRILFLEQIFINECLNQMWQHRIVVAYFKWRQLHDEIIDFECFIRNRSSGNILIEYLKIELNRMN